MEGGRNIMTIEYKDSKRIVKLAGDTITEATRSDFTGTWTSAGTANKISASGGIITSTFNTDNGVDARLTYDLGSGNVSDSLWILRAKVDVTNTISAPAQAVYLAFGISDNTTITGENGSGGNDFIGGTLQLQDNTQNSIMCINGSFTGGTNRASRMTSGNTYYVEIQRVSETSSTMKVFSDSTYSTQIGTISSNTPSSSLTGGRYLFFQHFTGNVSSGSGSLVVSDMKFYNSVSEIISKPTDVQNNSILIEKDTAKRYWFKSESETSSQTSTNDARSLKGTSRNKIGQQFNTGHVLVGQAPTKATFYLNKGGTPPNNVTAYIRNSSGTLRETSTTTIVADSLTGSAVATDFTFAGTTTLATGDMITVEYNSGDNNNYVNTWTNTASAVTNSILREYTSSWSNISGEALKFIVYYTTATWTRDKFPAWYEQTTRDNSGGLNNSTSRNYVMGHQNNTGSSKDVTSAIFRLAKIGTGGNGTVTARIYDSSFVLKHTSTNSIVVSSLTTSFVDTTFNFTDATCENTWVVCLYTTGNSSGDNFVLCGVDIVTGDTKKVVYGSSSFTTFNDRLVTITINGDN